MKTFRLEYSCPRKSTFDKNIVIWERKIHMIEAEDEAQAEMRAGVFTAWQEPVNGVHSPSIYKLVEITLPERTPRFSGLQVFVG